MDCLARALVVAARLWEDGALEEVRRDRYAGWDDGLGRRIRGGEETSGPLRRRALDTPDVHRRSGGQEALENLVARYIARTD